MLANASSNATADLKSVKEASSTMEWKGRLLMLIVNFIPLAHVIAVLLIVFFLPATTPIRVVCALGALYLAPPLLTRATRIAAPISEGRIALGSKPFFAWWFMFQLQVVFCRFMALEEVLRLIPGVYSQWLRLWGSRVGRLTYWSPGTLITDRSFLSIGDDVIFGAGVRLNAHVLERSNQGTAELILATVTVGNRAMIGGYSLLTAGTRISDDESTRAFLISPPFSVWKDGKRIRSGGDEL
ncbi:MAG TPA: hypothetical protein VH595_03270 [Verrucomicrobiae bacterium]|jgi:hypothetical protein|nr:hypothetical protein [Verrucomicrobiae bacterium]